MDGVEGGQQQDGGGDGLYGTVHGMRGRDGVFGLCVFWLEGPFEAFVRGGETGVADWTCVCARDDG